MKRTLITLGTAALTFASLTLSVSAADLMTLRMAADQTAFSTEELASGDKVIHGGLWIDNYTGITGLNLILRSDAPVLIENGDYTRVPGDQSKLAFFESYSKAEYTPKSLIDDDTNIIYWRGMEEDGKEGFQNGVIRDANSTFLSFDYRIPKDTPIGDYTCFVSDEVKTKGGMPIEDLNVSNSAGPLTLDKDFALKPVTLAVYMRGDVNCDGSVSGDDAQIALLYYVRSKVSKKTVSDSELAELAKTEHVEAAKHAVDASGNGDLDISDPQGILRYYVLTLAGKNADWGSIY